MDEQLRDEIIDTLKALIDIVRQGSDVQFVAVLLYAESLIQKLEPDNMEEL